MSFLLLAVYYSFLSSAVLGQIPSSGTVRLYRNGVADTIQYWSSGIVQIYYDDEWGNICDDYSYWFRSDEADVVCHQLGYTGASSYSITGTTTIWGTDTSETKLSQVSCSSSYLTVTQCSFSTSFSSLCSADRNDVTVSCYSTRIWSSPITGDIRLTGGTYSNQGLLEVYCNGLWGTVCDDYFFETQAEVACKQLGYNDYYNYDHLSITGNYYQPIYLRYLSGCSENDSCLTECGSCPSSGISSCTHYEDITLQCEYSINNSKIYSSSSDTCYHTTESPYTNTERPYTNRPYTTERPYTNRPYTTERPYTNRPYTTERPYTNTPYTNDDTYDDDDESADVSTGALVGITIASIISFIICLAVIFGVPICICVCLGVGLGAAASTGTTATTRAYIAPSSSTTVVSASTNAQQQSGYYPAGPNFGGSTDAPPSYFSSQTAAPQKGCATRVHLYA